MISRRRCLATAAALLALTASPALAAGARVAEIRASPPAASAPSAALGGSSIAIPATPGLPGAPSGLSAAIAPGAASAAPAPPAAVAPEAAKPAALAALAAPARAAHAPVSSVAPASAIAAVLPPDAATAASLLGSSRRALAGVSARDLETMPEERLQAFAASLLEGAPARRGLGGAAAAAAGPERPPLPRAAARPPAAAPAPLPAPSAPSAARRLVWPALVAVVWTSWAVMMTTHHHWGLFAHDWFMTVTMALGSFVAGATSEGSGSISFPAMTLLFHIQPAVARDFALMIQSVGMTAAAITIFARRIPVEMRAIAFGVVGGFLGMALGTTFVAPLLAPPLVKMFFASLWAAFALAHWRMDRERDRVVTERIEGFGARDALALLAFGVVGGIVSSIVGTGLCMVLFTLLTLGYRVSEKIATPTSVVLMASNALFGFLYKAAFAGGMAPAAWDYWWVCVPIVVIGAPLGARFIAGRSRAFVSRLLYAAIAAQLVAALLIIPQTWTLVATSAATFLVGSAVFRWMRRHGEARVQETRS